MQDWIGLDCGMVWCGVVRRKTNNTKVAYFRSADDI